jgi:beta-lactamase class A
VQYRADERFGFASTIKVFAAAAMLRQIPEDQRDARLTWTQEEMMAAGYSPVAEERLGTGMTIREAAEAAVRRSDNTAMNLVLGRIGGPAGLDAELVQLGDTTTEAIDSEPELNRVDPGSPANTTTPAAFTAALHEVMRSDYLSPTDRAVLIEWMSGNATGDALIRAGAPAGWEVADKSGGAGGIRNDIAIVTPPGRAPLILTVMTAKDDPAAAYEDELVAAVARTVLSAFE